MKAIAILVALVAAAPHAEAKGCHERSYVVGLQRCSWFGTWSRDANVPRLWLDVGYYHHVFTSQPFTLGSSALTTTPADLTTVTGGPVFRILGGIGDWFYTGGELAPGFLQQTPQVPGPAPTVSDYLAMHAIAGVHASLFRIGASAELAGGFRYEDFEYCPLGDRKCTGGSEASQTRRELEARLRIDVFLTPSLSLGTMFGKSLIDRDDRIVMLYLGLHLRNLDGMR